MYCSFVFHTLDAWNSSCWNSSVETVSPVMNWRQLTISRNYWNFTTGMWFSAESTHYIHDRNHLHPSNTPMPSIRAATLFNCPSHLSSIAALIEIPIPTPPNHLPALISRHFIRFTSSSNTGGSAKSMSSDHWSRWGGSFIPLFKISTSLVKFLIRCLWP